MSQPPSSARRSTEDEKTTESNLSVTLDLEKQEQKTSSDSFTLKRTQSTTTTHTETTARSETTRVTAWSEKKQSEEFQKLDLSEEKTTHVLEAHNISGHDGYQKLESSNSQSYGEDYPRTGLYQPLLSLPINKKPPLLRRILWGPVRVPTFSYLSMLTMIGILIYELVRSRQLTGSSIQTSPFNPMIGPSFQVLVNEGARFTPCIRTVPSYSSTSVFSNCFGSSSDTCTLEELCGFGGFFGGPPNQSFRFVLPIFMHAGVLHFFINMLTHLRLGVDLEKTLGTPRYAILYLSSGIWGFVLSAMLSSPSSASTGCSGALFGLIGYMFVDVLIRWKQLAHPLRDLMSLLMSTIISLIIGLFPGLDNFAHLGGFVVGILMGLFIAPKFPMATLKAKLAMWAVRLLALVGLIVLFVVTLHQLYSVTDPSTICPNCKYLSCIPVSNWCDPI